MPDGQNVERWGESTTFTTHRRRGTDKCLLALEEGWVPLQENHPETIWRRLEKNSGQVGLALLGANGNVRLENRATISDKHNHASAGAG